MEKYFIIKNVKRTSGGSYIITQNPKLYKNLVVEEN